MKAVILCGGLGTRIRDVAETLPKPMIQIGNRPILWHIMKGYAAHGVKEFVLCLGYKSWLIKEYFLNYRSMSADLVVQLGPQARVERVGLADDEDWSITLAETGEATMTGGRVAAIRKYVEGDEPFLLTYGDGVSDLNIGELIAFHRRHGKVATVTAVRPPGRFGELQVADDQVTRFHEKPQTSEGFINGGFFVLDGRKIWDYLAGDPGLVLESQPMHGLVADGELRAFKHEGFWQPMDTLREFRLLNDLWESGRAPWKTWAP
jgi:glucose-1-phosphate cytidylyltransferase